MQRSSALLCAALLLSAAAPAAPPIEQRMSAEERQTTGIARLTAAELAALNAWLECEWARADARSDGAGKRVASDDTERVGRLAATTNPTAEATTSEAKRSPRFGFRPSSAEREAVRSRIVGQFSGWTGKTVFTLANGQVWQQTDGERWSTRALRDPEVVIEPKAFGSWLLRVAPSNRTVRVTRIE